MKVALCVWGPSAGLRRRDGVNLTELLVPLIPVAALICLLILLEPNLSTTITIAIIVGALPWFAGCREGVREFRGAACCSPGLARSRDIAPSASAASSARSTIRQGAGYQRARPCTRWPTVVSWVSARTEPSQAELPAERAQRLHLRHRRRGTGTDRGAGRDRAVRRADADRMRIALRSVDPFLKMMAATITVPYGPGVHQHRIRRGLLPGDRHPAPACLGRWNVDADRVGHARPVR